MGTSSRTAMASGVGEEKAAAIVNVGRVRWVVCALLFFAATVNYIDRQVIGLLQPTLQAKFGWNDVDYSNIIFWFVAAYAAGLLVVGRAIDWLGTRKGFSIAVFVWSLAAIAHAFARSAFGFSAARSALGLGESGSFPASIKAVAEWFPKKERALATSIFNSGTNVGAIVTPAIVPWLTYRYGWQGAFIFTGAIGFVWLIFWLLLYRSPEQHPRVSAYELAYIRGDAAESVKPIRWLTLMKFRQTWAFAIGKFLTDPIWWVYLYWLPNFLDRNHHVKLSGMFWPLVVIYNGATMGSIFGGALSSWLLKRGSSVNRSRKLAMLLCAIAVVPIIAAARTTHLWTAVLLITIAAGAHQGWSANIFTLTSDMFPKRAVASVVGFGGMAGAVGGMLIAKAVGYILQWTGSYFPIFVIAGSAYLVALLVIQLLAPKLEPVNLDAVSP